MASVISLFLQQLPTIELDIPVRFLPRSVSQHFQGAPSPSGRQAHEHDLLIWTANHSESGGFPSTAQVVLLPGLANGTILELLADQTSDLLYTEPIRHLIDAMRQNGIERVFYTQCLCFALLIVLYTFFVIGAISMPPRAPLLHPESLPMFFLTSAAEYPVLWSAATSGALSCIISVYFLWREAHELFGNSAYEEEKTEKEQNELLAKLGVASSISSSSASSYPPSSSSGTGKLLLASKEKVQHSKGGLTQTNLAAHTIGRLDLNKRGSAWSVVSRFSDTHDRRNIAEFHRSSSSGIVLQWVALGCSELQ